MSINLKDSVSTSARPTYSWYGEFGFRADLEGNQALDKPVKQKRGTGRRLKALMERMRAAATEAEVGVLAVLATSGTVTIARKFSRASHTVGNTTHESVVESPLRSLGNVAIMHTADGFPVAAMPGNQIGDTEPMADVIELSPGAINSVGPDIGQHLGEEMLSRLVA